MNKSRFNARRAAKGHELFSRTVVRHRYIVKISYCTCRLERYLIGEDMAVHIDYFQLQKLL
jgi:hypothetical protein